MDTQSASGADPGRGKLARAAHPEHHRAPGPLSARPADPGAGHRHAGRRRRAARRGGTAAGHGPGRAALIVIGVLLLARHGIRAERTDAGRGLRGARGAAVRQVPGDDPRPGPALGEPAHPQAQGVDRIRNHETPMAKVNDLDGNPIEIAAVVVWQVEDTAGPSMRLTASPSSWPPRPRQRCGTSPPATPMRRHGSGELSLRDNAEEITGRLSAEIADRVAVGRRRTSSSRGSPGCPTRRDRPGDAAAAGRRAPSSARGSGSSRARSAWSSWP